MLRNSIRARLIAVVLAVQLVLAAGVVLTGVYYTSRRLRSSVDAGLQARAMRVAALVRFPEDNSTKLVFDDSLVPPAKDSRVPELFEVRTDDGSLVAHSQAWSGEIRTTPTRNRDFWNFRYDKVPYRAVRLKSVPVLDREQGSPDPGTMTVFYAVPLVEMREEIRETGVFLSGASLALVVLTGVLGLWAIRRSLHPLDQLATNAGRIDANNWKLEIPARAETPDELAPLIAAMQSMLAGLERSFRQQREFIADAAHELKTPVAILKSTLQSLQQKQRSAEEYRLGIDESLEDIGRLEGLVQQLLRLARAEQWSAGGVDREMEVVDVPESCERALTRVRQLARGKDIQCEVSGAREVFLWADPDDLEVIWGNLLENAIHYSPERSKISVAVDRIAGNRCRVIVADQGPGIPEEDLSRIFERFHRGDASRARDTGGFGLGLAIAKALVEAYRGSIEAESGPGKGTRIIVQFPTAERIAESDALSVRSGLFPHP